MDNRLIELSKYRLEKAQKDYQAAKTLFESGSYPQSLNRSYYAMFHAVRSLFALEQFDSKKHSGIISHFNQLYIRTGKIPDRFAKMLVSAQDLRNDSDYDDFFWPEREDAEKQFLCAKEFIDFIREYLGKMLGSY
jgi:uncharacterized protein (UPF0332 family)